LKRNTNNHPVFPHQRIGIFIDAQNIYHSAKHLYRSRVNFSELIKFLTGNRTLARAVAYVAKSDPITGEDSFFDALRKSGFELRIKDLQIFSDGSKKADWDVGIAVDAIRTAHSLDVIILVTGDGDFIPLVEYLQVGLGKRVEVAGFSKTTSGHLKEVVDRIIELEDIPKILLPIHQQKRTKRRQK
jgi:uncharacterized LabA/DUF88 family protein